ncbi:type II toxin-antitoxin system Phd/YefM family antitoxin [Rhodohalobacter sp. 614A]|uniref:type II toxin-antitoxin system Phd/YefM family antitoxin n=1 Tax=Rhodohalobacter sp. 614A TaxID=2908649 RepID=UPI001F3CC2EE|nr:type II toxin-antitoxin system Phd/YefM family antitoxin [Rhodohalobacter sp. 614A]
MDVKTVNSSSARQSFSDILNDSGYGGQRIVVTRKGKAVAAVVPIEDLEAIQALEDHKDVEEARRILSDSKSEFIPWEQAKKELIKK